MWLCTHLSASQAAERLARMNGEQTGLSASSLVNAVDVDGRRPLHYAACHGSSAVVTLLLQKHADESAVDSDGYSALHYACRWNQPDAVDILVWHCDVRCCARQAVSYPSRECKY